MRVVVFDTETTGFVLPGLVDLDKQPKIIELGLVIVEDGKVVEDYNWLINPGIPIPADTIKVHGVTDEMVKDCPDFASVWNEFASGYINGADAVVAHNLPFDKSMVDNEVQHLTGQPFGCGWPAIQICSVQEFVHEFGRRPKLTELYERYMGMPLAQTHRASDDAKALAEVLLKINFFDALNFTF